MEAAKLDRGLVKRLTIRSVVPALALYVAIAVAFSWPAAIHPNTTVIGDADALGNIWWAWARLNGLIDVFHCTKLVAWPEGSCGPMPSQPLNEYVFLAFAWVTSAVTGWTLYICLSLIASALTAFVLLHQRGISVMPAIWGGALVGFNAPTLAQLLGGHSAYALAVPVLFFLDRLEKLWAAGGDPIAFRDISTLTNLPNGPIRLGISTGLWLGLVFATSIYSGYFLSVLASLVGVGAVIRAAALRASKSNLEGDKNTHRARGALRVVGPYFIMLLIAAVIAFSCNALIVAHAIGALPNHAVQSGGFFSRDFADLTTYGARPLDYLRPFPWHPFWGEILHLNQKLPARAGNAYEMSLFPGIVTFLFALLGALLYRKTPRTTLHDLFARVSVFVLIMFFMSFTPMWAPIGSIELPTLSKFLYPFASMFRVYARCGIFVAIGLGILASIGLVWTLNYTQLNSRKIKPFFRWKSLVFMVFCAAGILELFPTSLGRGNTTVSAKQMPNTTAIAALPKNAVIANYPLFAPIDLSHYRYIFWQRQHKKPMINGMYTPGTHYEIPKGLTDPADPATLTQLRNLGVTHIVIHPELYASGSVAEAILGPANAIADPTELPRISPQYAKRIAENIYSLVGAEGRSGE
jgi:hypothetical protein